MEQSEVYLSTSQSYQRPVAAIIDYVLIFLFSIFGFLGMNFALTRTSYAQNQYDVFMKCYLESNLYVEETAENGSVSYVPHKYESYEEYEDLIADFFFKYMNENNQTRKYDNYWFNIFIYGQDDVLNKFTEEQLATRYIDLNDIGKQLFTYKTDENGNKLPNELAIPVKNETPEEKKALVDYYYSLNKPSVYGLAVHMLTLQDFFVPSKNAYASWYTFTMYMPLAISIAVFTIIFRYLIPIFSKKRQSLGKRAMKLGVFNEDGTKISVLKFTIRTFTPLIVVEGLLAISNFFMGGNMSSFFLFSIALGVVSFACSSFTKNKTALHDMIVNSRVYDLKTSVLPMDVVTPKVLAPSEEEKVEDLDGGK